MDELPTLTPLELRQLLPRIVRLGVLLTLDSQRAGDIDTMRGPAPASAAPLVLRRGRDPRSARAAASDDPRLPPLPPPFPTPRSRGSSGARHRNVRFGAAAAAAQSLCRPGVATKRPHSGSIVDSLQIVPALLFADDADDDADGDAAVGAAWDAGGASGRGGRARPSAGVPPPPTAAAVTTAPDWCLEPMLRPRGAAGHLDAAAPVAACDAASCWNDDDALAAGLDPGAGGLAALASGATLSDASAASAAHGSTESSLSAAACDARTGGGGSSVAATLHMSALSAPRSSRIAPLPPAVVTAFGDADDGMHV